MMDYQAQKNSIQADRNAAADAAAAEMDAYLASFDIREAAATSTRTDRTAAVRAAGARATAAAPQLPRRARRAARLDAMRAEMDARPPVHITPAMEESYREYLSDGLADTDGYFAPIDRESYFRLYPVS